MVVVRLSMSLVTGSARRRGVTVEVTQRQPAQLLFDVTTKTRHHSLRDAGHRETWK